MSRDDSYRRVPPPTGCVSVGELYRFVAEELGYSSPLYVEGCAADEVDTVEAVVGVHLPARYREYLLIAGREPGPFFNGTDMFYPAVLKLREWAVELLEDNERPIQLPEDAIAIAMHQGYVMHWIRASEGDDPPVYQYVEGEDPEPCWRWSSFTAYIGAACGFPLAGREAR